MPCFGWGPFPTLCWSAIPTELVNAKMQLAGVRHSPEFSPATFSLRLKERCKALSPTTPDKRDLLWTGTSAQGRAWGLSVRAAWVWGINSYLFVRKNSRKHWTSPPKPSTLLGWTNTLEAESFELLSCAHRHSISSSWRTETLLTQQTRDWSLKLC